MTSASFFPIGFWYADDILIPSLVGFFGDDECADPRDEGYAQFKVASSERSQSLRRVRHDNAESVLTWIFHRRDRRAEFRILLRGLCAL